ncbi:hypothetical protein IWZ01DRAFT_544395 [Phyllosticta capitalensis]
MATPQVQIQAATAVPSLHFPNQLAERLWVEALRKIRKGHIEVVIPFEVSYALGQDGINRVAQRFSEHIKAPVSKAVDELHCALRLLPPPGMFQSDHPFGVDLSSSVNSDLLPAKPPATVDAKTTRTRILDAIPDAEDGKQKPKPKVPRPCNPFIMYRNFLHQKVTMENPGLHNNQISKIIGRMWQAEPAEAKEYWRDQAKQSKEEHLLKFPDYQYRPRKPGQKKRRMTKKKLAEAAAAAPVRPTISDDALTFDPPIPVPTAPGQTAKYLLDPTQNYRGYNLQPDQTGVNMFKASLSRHTDEGRPTTHNPLVTMSSNAATDQDAYAASFDSVDLQKQAEAMDVAEKQLRHALLDDLGYSVQAANDRTFTEHSFNATANREVSLTTEPTVKVFDFPLGDLNYDFLGGSGLDFGSLNNI